MKRGISSVISSILIILIVFVAVVLAYNLVIPIVKEESGSAEKGINKLIRDLFSFSAQQDTSLPQSLLPLSPTGEIIYPGDEKCYIQLEINEKKIKDIFDDKGEIISQEIEFSLLNLTNLYGLYDTSIEYYDEENPSSYILRTYDKDGNILANFSLSLGRFIFYDTFEQENPGGVIEINESIISIIMPFDMKIRAIKIEQNNTLTNLNINPSDLKCERTCKLENEIAVEEKCCSGLIKIKQANGNFICVKCGDNVCSEYEDEYSCYEDCKKDFACKQGYVKGEFECALGISITNCTTLSQAGTYLLESDIEDNNIIDSCMKINAEDIILDCQNHRIKSENAVVGVYSNKKNTTIKNCIIDIGKSYEGEGIYLESADNSLILNNNLSNQYRGLTLASTSYTRIEKNIANNNKVEGISVYDASSDNIIDSHDNLLQDNIADNNGYFGVNIMGSKGIILKNNTANNNNLYSYGGIAVQSSSDILLENNTACYNIRGGAGSDLQCHSSAASGSGNRFEIILGCENVEYSGC